ncbi:MFS transporter [Curtobacterium sp. MCPF17_031]|nr:MFS transporter [Curtobacterium sp. MCPF17_031]
MRTRPPLTLIALFFMAFVFYTNDYMIAGVLPEVARGLGTSVSTAGQLVTFFSLTIAIVAPVAAVTLARLPRRRVFVMALLLFVSANAVAATSPSFLALVLLRIAAAAAAAAATPALHAFAAQIAPSGKRGRYTAIVTLGVTGSLAAGVPLGTWIGGQLGWRATFLTMAGAGVLALALVLVLVPLGVPTNVPPSLRQQMKALTEAPIVLGLAATCALMCGTMMLLTYFASYLDAMTHAGIGERAAALGLAGLAGMVGVVGGGIAVDRMGAERTLYIGVAAFCLTMVALWLLRFVAPIPFPIILGLGIVWGATAFWNAPAIQIRLYGLSAALAPQALALNTSSNFLGVSLGGALGGLIVAGFGVSHIPLLSAAFGAAALVLLSGAQRWGFSART